MSHQMLMSMIGMRFHECLHRESKAQPNLAETMSDAELIHSVCRKERLTFYNFMSQSGVASSEDIKS